MCQTTESSLPLNCSQSNQSHACQSTGGSCVCVGAGAGGITNVPKGARQVTSTESTPIVPGPPAAMKQRDCIGCGKVPVNGPTYCPTCRLKVSMGKPLDDEDTPTFRECRRAWSPPVRGLREYPKREVR